MTVGTYNLSALKSSFSGMSKTTKIERSDLIELLQGRPVSECKEYYDFVNKNKKLFTKDEIEVYGAASKPGGLKRLILLDKKKKRARLAGIKLSKLKKGAFEDDDEWNAM